MSGKLESNIVGKAAKESIASVEACAESAELWAQKVACQDTTDEAALLEAWKSNFEKLKKLNKRHVDKKGGDVVSKREAEKVLVDAVKKTLGGEAGEEGAPVAGSGSGASGAASGKRRGSKSAAPSIAAATSSADEKAGAVARAGSPKKSRVEKEGEEKKKKKVKKAKTGEAIWKKTSIPPSPTIEFTPEEFRKSLKRVVEADGSLVPSNVDLYFINWGSNVRNKPNVTFEPKSRTGVQNIVMWARKHDKRVRACGYRHTWSDMYSENDQVLISMLPVSVGTDHQVLIHDDIIWNEDDLEGIKIVKVVTDEKTGSRVGHCKIGASTTNEQFRRWCLRKGAENGGNWEWTLPLNVIMVEITFGGSNSPICHGAGLRNETLSDLVVEIEFVNPKGLIQRVSDPEQLRAASGAFGLLGIVTAVTLKLDPMTYAHMMPTKTHVQESIPPPAGFDIPDDLKLRKPYKQEKVDAHVTAFEKHCREDHYSEWFWFPFQERTWNNCWIATPEGKSRAKPMSELSAITQGLQGILGQAFNETLGKFSGSFQTRIMAHSAMDALPELSEPHLVPYIDALHFRRGIQNMKVVDMELEIPIPDDGHGHPDWSICRRAWWDIIKLVYKHKDQGKYPMRVALEMRIMGGSNVLMAPQFGNKHGTCSIEVLTTLQVPTPEWHSFMQEVADIWHGYMAEYKDHEGKPINIRSHWAKQWQELSIAGQSAVDYYRTVAYKDRIPEFLAQLKNVARAGGYKVGDLKTRFSTPLLDQIFFHE
jgi:hypothetical protein